MRKVIKIENQNSKNWFIYDFGEMELFALYNPVGSARPNGVYSDVPPKS